VDVGGEEENFTIRSSLADFKEKSATAALRPALKARQKRDYFEDSGGGKLLAGLTPPKLPSA
jgi:hypothetical protein